MSILCWRRFKIGKNIGKVFEQNWRKSIPDDIFYYRPQDSAQSFSQNSNLRFSAKSPCDCFIFDGDFLFAMELKSVGSTKSISFEREKKDHGVIHKHQIDNLNKFSQYKNIICGFVFDFRINDMTYFCSISDFIKMIEQLNKKSFNEDDLNELCKPILINKKKMKVNYKYNIEKLLIDLKNDRFRN